MAPFQLQVVNSVLSRRDSVSVLPHINALISTFLGPSSNLSLSEACTYKSISLLDWIWATSCTSPDKRTSRWTLSNYLRSEPLYNEWQFRESLQVAAENGDMDILKWLFDHFSGFQVPSEAVTKAAGKGHLPVLQFLLQHDQGREYNHIREKVELEEDSWTDSVPEMPKDWNGPGNVVRWGGHATRDAVEGKHFEIVKWLDENSPHENDTEEMDKVIGVAVNGGSVAFAEPLLPPDTKVVHYALDYAQPDAIQWLLENDFIKKNRDTTAYAIVTLAREGNLDLMKKVTKVHSRKRLNQEWINKWDFAMECACKRGDLPMVKWMAQDRAGRAVLDKAKRVDFLNFSNIISSTAKAGHIDVLEYLFECGWPDQNATSLEEAAGAGHLDCVKWLLKNAPPYDEDDYASSVVVSAAKNGHMEILLFFHDLYLNELDRPNHVDGESSSKRRRTRQTTDWWSQANEALEGAAAKGHLEVVKWLHANHFEDCGHISLDKPAHNGHLEVLKWLHENTDAKCTESAMTNAAFKGHLKVCEWLHANRSEGCTASAVKYAIGNGHLRVAYWLRLHYPQYIPEHNRMWKYPRNTFDLLLFLQVHYPTLFTLEFGRGTKSDLRHDKTASGDHLIAQWLDVKYPGDATERHQLVMWPLMF